MQKILPTVIFIVLGYILPLVGKIELVTHYKILILLTACFTIFLTQPSLNVEEAQAKQSTDRYSFFLIFILSLIGIVAPIIEWAYFKPDLNDAQWLLLGLLILVLGILIRVWAIRTLGRFFTVTVQLVDNHALVKNGPYAFVRHPSYLGAFLAFIGSAIILEAWIGLVIAIVAMLIAYYTRIKYEEKALVQTFGEQYEVYQSETKKMLPFIW